MTPDERIIAALTTGGVVRPARISPAETVTMRVAALAASPLWVAAVGAASVFRLVRGRLPLVVLHQRVGFERRPLAVPKIATARVPSNERRVFGLIEVATGPPVELDVDGRVERWLRRTGLDELPQLLLVVVGTMRLVGPRPVTQSELDEMAVDGEVGVDHLVPGLVGLWQILDRHAYTLTERRALDMLMIDNWSPNLRRQVLAVAFHQARRRLSSSV